MKKVSAWKSIMMTAIAGIVWKNVNKCVRLVISLIALKIVMFTLAIVLSN